MVPREENEAATLRGKFMNGIDKRDRSARGARGDSQHKIGRRQGFTLIEMAISVSILMIGIVSVASASSRMNALRQATREKAQAMNAMRSIAERIHAASANLSSDTKDWARDLGAIYGPDGSFGQTFDVRGLTPFGGAPAVGSILLVTDETLTDAALGFQLGMPRDLNGDSDTLDTDVGLDARILPVLLEVQWTGGHGRQVMRQGLFVTGY